MNVKKLFLIGIYAFFILGLISCKEDTEEPPEIVSLADHTKNTKPKYPLSEDFKKYWYAGEAEITSYKLEQARYGELRDGKAVLVFVTEDFLPQEQVKADNYSKDNIPVLKLNATKNFNTGIYPYSIMQSTFYPVANNQHVLKVSASIQEWCGHVYTQLNNGTQFEIKSHSYFEGEGDQDFKLSKSFTENEIWTQLRIDPNSLPTGTIEIIPSLEFLRLSHQKIQPYEAMAVLDEGKYILTYPDSNRRLQINFNPNFPFDILGWEESYSSGFGPNAKTLTTKANRLESIKSDYWSKNSNADEVLRESLKLQ